MYTCSARTQTQTYSTLIKCCCRRQWHSQQQQQPPGKTAGRLISISWMCLCTFISTSAWHFHRNYWANQLTSEGSGLACSLSLGNISLSCFSLFNVSGENNSTSVKVGFPGWCVVHGLVCVCVVFCWFVETLVPLDAALFLKDYHYDILWLQRKIQCRLTGELEDR